MVTVLSAENLTVRSREGDVVDLDFELQLGEAVAATAVGPTDLRRLLEVLAGLTSPDGGKVTWNRLRAVSLLEEKGTSSHRRYRILRSLRQTCAYVSGSISLLHNLDLFENIALPLRYHFNAPEGVVEERTRRLIEVLELEHAMHERPAGLPLGVTRRAIIGRALILEPTILCVESPFSDLDDKSTAIIVRTLEQYRAKTGLAVLAAGYEPRSLLPLASRVLIFRYGRLEWIAEEAALEVKSFFEVLGKLQGRVRQEDREVSETEVSCARP